MLVHFPIALLLIAVGLEFIVLMRGGDLIAERPLAPIALSTLLLGTVGAIAAAIFGDIALDKAVKLGFPEAPLETHEELGLATLWIFLGLALVHLLAWWRGIALSAWRGWVLFAVGLAGIGVLLSAAYHGGDLVYGLGVNVAPVKP